MDIQEKILSAYGIDIAQENIFKLYKITDANMSVSELENHIRETRNRWNQSINGANEKIAERDRARLQNAEKYEKILRDEQLFRELGAYYNGSGKTQNNSSEEELRFAREYFKILETSKKITKKDVDFFFAYFKNKKLNKAGIEAMLEKEFKIKRFAKKGKAEENAAEAEPEEEEKKKDSSLIVNLFQKNTVMQLRKCLDYYEACLNSEDICRRYPAVQDSLYRLLDLDKYTDAASCAKVVSGKKEEVYAVRQERGTQFIPLVDLYNGIDKVLAYNDVKDNFSEFKLLVKYPLLTPYMYAFTEVKKTTMDGLITIANREYAFRNDSDFIINYYEPVYDNFGITNNGISGIIKKAHKQAKTNAILDKLDEKIGREKQRKTLPVGALILYGCAYWPIFLTYFLFELFKFIFTNLYRLVKPIFVVSFIGANILFPKVFGIDNLLCLRYIFFKAKWYPLLVEFAQDEIHSGLSAFMLSLSFILFLVAVYVLPALFVALFTKHVSEAMSKGFDWIGYERTFKQVIFRKLRNKAEKLYGVNKSAYVKRMLMKLGVNILCAGILALLLFVVPIAFRAISEATGYFQ